MGKKPNYLQAFFWGIILFSCSIFIICLAKLTPFDFSWLGPVTPIGGGLAHYGMGFTTLENLSK